MHAFDYVYGFHVIRPFYSYCVAQKSTYDSFPLSVIMKFRNSTRKTKTFEVHRHPKNSSYLTNHKRPVNIINFHYNEESYIYIFF